MCALNWGICLLICSIAIITAVIEIDALPFLYRSLIEERSKTTLLKVLDGLVQTYAETGKFPFFLSHTCNFMVDLFDMTIDQTLHEKTLDTVLENIFVYFERSCK
jgi:hypothetical protein